MLKTAMRVGLFLGAFVFLGSSPAYAASSNEFMATTQSSNVSANSGAFKLTALVASSGNPEADKKPIDKPLTPPPENKPVQHIVADGESLSMIAEQHASTWIRLFAKNTQITNPDILHVGDTITIPFADEQLPVRPLPVSQAQADIVSTGQSQTTANNVAAYRSSSAGNTYTAGYCTWYAKQRRPDLPNNLGNADTWVARAASLGFATGSNPSVGAIGQQGMHVVYVESVNGDGTVTISEMNYQGLYITSSRTVPAGNFMYIY